METRWRQVLEIHRSSFRTESCLKQKIFLVHFHRVVANKYKYYPQYYAMPRLGYALRWQNWPVNPGLHEQSLGAMQNPLPLQALGSFGLNPAHVKLGAPLAVNWHLSPRKLSQQAQVSGATQPPRPLQTLGSNAVLPKQEESSQRSPIRPQLQAQVLFATQVPALEQAPAALDGVPKHVDAGTHLPSKDVPVMSHSSVVLLQAMGWTIAVPDAMQQICVLGLKQIANRPPCLAQIVCPDGQQTRGMGPPSNTGVPSWHCVPEGQQMAPRGESAPQTV